MRWILYSLIFALPLSVRAEGPALFSEAVAHQQLRAEFAGNGHDSATLKLTNLTPSPLALRVPAGTVLTGPNGENQITLRALQTEVAAHGAADAVLPTAALSAKNTREQRALTPASTGEPRLTKLLTLFEPQNDLPRPTAQLAILVLLENVSWPDWQQWQAPAWAAEKPAKPHPTPADVAQAVDALAFVHLAAPDAHPALLADDTFKRLALRNPWARAKAMALYGLGIEDAITGDSALPPDLSKLLHTSANDNCPICRQRAQMQSGSGF